MKGSLVIPTYNKLGRLKLVLESIKYQSTSKKNYEVILIDDGSVDGTKEYLEETQFSFHCQKIFQDHKGRACARNTGIKNAQNEIIIFTDDDLILDKEFIQKHIEYHKQKRQIVHGQIINLTRTKFFLNPTEGTFYDDLTIRAKVKESLMKERIFPSMLKNSTEFDKYVSKNGRTTVLEGTIHKCLTEYPGKLDWISFVGGNTSVSKDILEEVHGFDEKFGLNWGCEDIELGYRLMKQGIPFIYATDAKNYHISHYRANFSDEHAINSTYFYEKYKDNAIVYFHEFISGKITKDEMISKIL